MGVQLVRFQWLKALTRKQETPLHEACSRGHTDVVKLFLDDIRVDPNIQDEDGVGIQRFGGPPEKIIV